MAADRGGAPAQATGDGSWRVHERVEALNFEQGDSDNHRMRLLVDRPGLRPWLGAVTTLGGVVGLTFVGPFADPGWESPLALFWLVVVAAGLCALGAAA